MVGSRQALFLHGLAGNGREWGALQDRIPAEAPDLRPHGTRDEYVSEVVEIIGEDRVALIGQSLHDVHLEDPTTLAGLIAV